LAEGANDQSRRFFTLNRDHRLIARFVDQLMALGARGDREKFISATLSSLPVADRAVMLEPGIADAYVTAVVGAFRQGTRGPQLDAALVSNAWDFAPRLIDTKVYLWHGTDDTNVPLAMGQWISQNLSDCSSNFVADEGHISLIVHRAELILRAVSS
jgi:hypothetical protein